LPQMRAGIFNALIFRKISVDALRNPLASAG
jgi:hypothetical protein